MGTLIGRLAQEKFASLMDQWIQENAAMFAIGAHVAPFQPPRMPQQQHIPSCIPIRNKTATNALSVSDQGTALDRDQFEAANERLCAILKRLAPDGGWLCENPLYPRFEDAARLRLAGYACRWSGCVVNRSFLGFRKQRHVYFETYSWSWDGAIDETWLRDRIAERKHRTYRLSDPRTPETRNMIGVPWVRED